MRHDDSLGAPACNCVSEGLDCEESNTAVKEMFAVRVGHGLERGRIPGRRGFGLGQRMNSAARCLPRIMRPLCSTITKGQIVRQIGGMFWLLQSLNGRQTKLVMISAIAPTWQRRESELSQAPATRAEPLCPSLR